MKIADKEKAATVKDGAAPKAGLASRQRTQLMILGALTLVLGIVLVQQFSSDEVPALAALDEGVALALTAEAPVEVEEEPVVEVAAANPVLSQDIEEPEALARDPFSAFWDTSDSGDATTIEIQTPTVSLGATLTSRRLPIAVIDGQMRFIGDNVQGWTLDQILERSIVLRSPSNDIFTIQMPVLYGRIDAPVPVGDVLPESVRAPGTGLHAASDPNSPPSPPVEAWTAPSSGPSADDDSRD